MFESWKEREFEKKMERFRTALQEKNTILIGAGNDCRAFFQL